MVLSAAGTSPYKLIEHAVGIWSDCPLLEAVPVSDPRLGACAILQTPLGPIAVYGTVLPFRDEGRSSGLAQWQMHRETLQRQIHDWKAIRDRFPGHHLLVAGDFNMTMEPSNAYVDRESREALLSACGRLGLSCLTADDTRPTIGRSNVDHILASEGLAQTAQTHYWQPGATFREVQHRLSDHNGCHVDLTAKVN